MALSLLNRYLSPEALNHLANRPLQPLELVIGNLAGAHKSPLSGFAVEFAGHREYAPGDDPKHIDWRVYFSRDKYFVKQYELETNFTCHLLLDVSASMRYGEGELQKLNYASRLAVTLGHAVVSQSDKVSLSTFDDEVRGYVTPSNSMHQIVRMAHHLDEINPVEKTSLSSCLNEIVNRTGRREIVMLFSDFFADVSELESVIQRMRYQKHEVVLFHVMHPDELTFELDGMIKFVGLESEDDMLAQSEDLRQGYLTAMKAFQTELEDIASRNRCEYVLADTSRSMGEMLADYLNRRSRLNRGR